MTIKQKDRNRAELVQAIIRQNGGRIFTVIAKRKTPKRYFIIEDSCMDFGVPVGEKVYLSTKKAEKQLAALQADGCKVSVFEEHFMEMTCRTGVKKDLKGGESTIKHKSDLISVNLTNGKGYRCFSAFNVLELRAGGTVIKFKEADVLAFQEEATCEGK